MAVLDRLKQSNDQAEISQEAHRLAATMPELLIEARRVAHTVTHGIHGRRRAGPGETFWQFRHFENSDSANLIDWRRSASSDHLFVREREWEAAHTVWLWPDVSHAMSFKSHLSTVTKAARALVLTLAVGELLSNAGERIGVPGLMPANSNRNASQRMAEIFMHQLKNSQTQPAEPPLDGLNRFSEYILISDFLDPIEEISARLDEISNRGVRGHLVQVLDPAEETLPYAGRVLFEDMSAGGNAGEQVLTGRAEDLREKYQRRLAAHRDALRDKTQRMEWSFMLHHTDQPPSKMLMALYSRLSGNEINHPQAGIRAEQNNSKRSAELER